MDIFFVISGYLITNLILKDIDKDRFHFVDFLERRIRRIIPALTTVVLATFVAGWYLFLPLDFHELGESVTAQALVHSNIHFWFHSGYFDQNATLRPLLHTWSLAVEEQFYFLFPFVLLLVHRISRKLVLPFIGLLFGASFILSVYCSYRHPSANFYLLPTRAWELLVGSILASYSPRVPMTTLQREVLGWGGLAALGWAVFGFNSETRFPGFYALVPCLGAALIIASNRVTTNTVGKLLSVRPMVFIGLISYSLYLWHWPILVFPKYVLQGHLSQTQRFLSIAVIFVIAALSWKFIETPFRTRSLLKKKSFVLAAAALVTIFFALLGVFVAQNNGLPSRIPPQALRFTRDPKLSFGFHQTTLREVLDGKLTELGTIDKSTPIDLLVWGDSHASALAPVFESICKTHSMRGQIARHAATAPAVGYESRNPQSLCEDSLLYSEAIIEHVRRNAIKNVVLVARWDFYIEADQGTSRLRNGLLSTITEMERLGTQLWIVRQVPQYDFNVPNALANAIWHKSSIEKLGLDQNDHLRNHKKQDSLFNGLTDNFARVTILDPTPLFTQNGGRCLVYHQNECLYFDADHLSPSGAHFLRPLFEPCFSTEP